MKTYSDIERKTALEQLPKPVRDFVESHVLTEIYMGIFKKLKIDLQQALVISLHTNTALLGLEPESAFEHNLHQDLPELSNDAMRELVADINDRVFKEAKRRIQENIVTPEKKWDVENFGDKKTYTPPITDSELEKKVDEEEKNGGFKEPIKDKEPEEPLPKTASHTNTVATDETVTPPSSIALSKLSQPTENSTQTTEVQRPIQKIAVTLPPPAPRLKGDSDPYREIAE